MDTDHSAVPCGIAVRVGSEHLIILGFMIVIFIFCVRDVMVFYMLLSPIKTYSNTLTQVPKPEDKDEQDSEEESDDSKEEGENESDNELWEEDFQEEPSEDEDSDGIEEEEPDTKSENEEEKDNSKEEKRENYYVEENVLVEEH